MKYLYPLNAIHSDGSVLLLYSLDEVHKFIKDYGKFAPRRVEWFYDYSSGFFRENIGNGWIMRDDAGYPVKFEDVCPEYPRYVHYNQNMQKVREIASKGLPIPHTGCSKAGWKMNHTAKKNSGAKHRNRNRSLCEYDRIEYGIKNPYGKVKPWENSR